MKTHAKFEKLFLYLYFINAFAGLIIGASLADIDVGTNNFNKYSLITMAVFALLFTVVSLRFKNGILKEKFKKPGKESNKIKVASSSKFGVYQKLQLWTAQANKFYMSLITLFVIIIAIDTLKNKTSIGISIFKAIPFLMILLLIYPPENILVALPYNLYKIHIKNKIFNLFLFLIFNAIYLAAAYFFKILSTEMLPALFLINAFFFSVASLLPVNDSASGMLMMVMFFRNNFLEIFIKFNFTGYAIATIVFFLIYISGPAIVFSFFEDKYATGKFNIRERILQIFSN